MVRPKRASDAAGESYGGGNQGAGGPADTSGPRLVAGEDNGGAPLVERDGGSPAVPAARRRATRVGVVLRGVARSTASGRRGTVGVSAIVVLLLLIPFGPILAPYSASSQHIADRLQGPSSAHLLGTDQLGRDLLSRLLAGVRVELGVAVPSVLVALVIGSALGVAAGYMGRTVDNVMILIMDTLQSFPAVILALLLLSLLGPSLPDVIIVIAIAYTPTFGRVTRALVASTREREFVAAERSLGAGHTRMVMRHILPNVTAPLVVLVALNIPSAIAIEVGLSFLGLGVPPPTPSWGSMLADGFTYVRTSPWGALCAMGAVMITTLILVSVGEHLRDISDPRAANAIGRL